MTAYDSMLRDCYVAFNARDMDGALSRMAPDVDWPNGMEGGRVHGHDAVRSYWTRQWNLIDPRVDPESFTTESDGRIRVRVHQVIRDHDGAMLSDGYVDHVYSVRDGLVKHMEIRPDKAGA